MPEGPEIRRAADRIGDVLVGETIETVRFGLPRLRHYGRKLRGHRVTAVETRGKAMLTRFDSGLTRQKTQQGETRAQKTRIKKYVSSKRNCIYDLIQENYGLFQGRFGSVRLFLGSVRF